jgi:DNA-binding response OmpR family regulator
MLEDDDGHARLIERTYAGQQKAARQSAPILILLDLNLPDMSSLAILEYAKSEGHLKPGPIIILTITDDEDEINSCYGVGYCVYITKPVDYEQFASAARQLGLFFAVIKVPDLINA